MIKVKELSKVVIANLAAHINLIATEKGFWEHTDENDSSRLDMAFIAEKLCLIHSEISEALEGLQHPGKDQHLTHRESFDVEIMDAIIRLFDLVAQLEIDWEILFEKIEYNAGRPWLHGKEF